MGEIVKWLLDKTPDIIAKVAESPLGFVSIIFIVVPTVGFASFRIAAGKWEVANLVMFTCGVLGFYIVAGNTTTKPDLTIGPPEKQPTDRTVQIYYATNRAADNQSRIIDYTGDRADKLSFGITQVRIPDNHHTGNVEYDESLINIQIDRDYMKYNFVVRGINPLKHDEFIELLRGDKRDTALVFVHGYNNSFDDGAFRLAQIVWDGQLHDLIPVLFSWPSKNDARAYLYDGESAELSVDYFIELLKLLQKQAGIKTVHIIAHSMGNRIVLNAISKAVDILKSRPLGEVVLAAADVDRQRFVQLINEVRNISHGMTLYASAADAALWWSGKAASGDRAGTVTNDGPVVVDGVESIDMTSANRERSILERTLDWISGRFSVKDLLGLNTHNTFVSPLIVDIARLVEKGEHPPPSRTALIHGVPEDTPKYWRYAD